VALKNSFPLKLLDKIIALSFSPDLLLYWDIAATVSVAECFEQWHSWVDGNMPFVKASSYDPSCTGAAIRANVALL